MTTYTLTGFSIVNGPMDSPATDFTASTTLEIIVEDGQGDFSYLIDPSSDPSSNPPDANITITGLILSRLDGFNILDGSLTSSVGIVEWDDNGTTRTTIFLSLVNGAELNRIFVIGGDDFPEFTSLAEFNDFVANDIINVGEVTSGPFAPGVTTPLTDFFEVGVTEDDNIRSSTGTDDIYNLGQGNDTIEALDGFDQVFGGEGNDTIRIVDTPGSTGPLLASAGSIYDGGEGVDTLFIIDSAFSPGSIDLRPYLLSNFETLFLGSSFPAGSLPAPASVSINASQFSANFTTVRSLTGSGDTVTIFLDTETSLDLSGVNFISFNNLGDRVIIEGDGDNENITGSSVNDIINGGAGADMLFGGDGNDIINGGSQSDQLFGGAGDDTLNGGTGVDTVDGGDGIDTVDLSGATNTQTVNLVTNNNIGGFANNDTFIDIENVIGSATNGDNVTGSAGNNEIFGLGAGDILRGFNGDDLLDGGTGNDFLFGGRGADRLDGGEGVDFAIYTDSSVGVTIDLLAGTGSGGTAEGDTLTNIERIRGSFHDDNLTGDNGSNRILGDDGADTINGLGGVDVLRGGDGNDIINGGADRDSIQGNDGNDIINGGSGIDSLLGNAGDDIFVFEAGNQLDNIFDFDDNGDDRIDLTSFNFTDYSEIEALTRQAGTSVRIDLGGDDIILLRNTDLSTVTEEDFIF